MENARKGGSRNLQKGPLAVFFGGGNLGDQVFRVLTGIFAGLAVLVLAAMALQMFRASLPSLKQFGWRFLASTDWDPVLDAYRALPYIFGTLASSLLARVITRQPGQGR